MIATLTGTIDQLLPAAIIIQINGIGYEVRVPLSELSDSIGSNIKVWVHEHIREDAHDLYGFKSFETKQLFEQLLTVNGVGPKAALALLSSLNTDGVRQSIANSEVGILQSAPGIGKRTAERIVVELKNKVGVAGSGSNDTAHAALVSLGYSLQVASEALSKVSGDSDEERIKAALQVLSK